MVVVALSAAAVDQKHVPSILSSELLRELDQRPNSK